MLLKCIFSNDNAPKLVLQIRFKNDDDKDAASAEDGSDDDVFLKKVSTRARTNTDSCWAVAPGQTACARIHSRTSICFVYLLALLFLSRWRSPF